MDDSRKFKNITLLELNEISFEVVKKYIEHGTKLPGFSQVISWSNAETSSEEEYALLEPWIQWMSIHTGLTYAEHEVFRLGDVVNSKSKTIFEIIEDKGFSVAALSPMNIDNRLSRSAYFVPDPWTASTTDGSWVSEFLRAGIVQLVNDNASGRITFKTAIKIIAVSLYLLNIYELTKIFLKFKSASRDRKWRKVLAFDMFLTKVFLKLQRKKSPDFSVLFLNGGAHIQHHYMLSSPHVGINGVNQNPDWYCNNDFDPVLEMLIQYDEIIQELIESKSRIIVATGLSQMACAETIFYYRLKNHDEFLSKLGIKFKEVKPRMSRDFLVEFNNNEDRDDGLRILSKIIANDGKKVFGLIDVREASLFVTLDYDLEITAETFAMPGNAGNLFEEVVLVAIKNGEHCPKGYVFTSPELPSVKNLGNKHCKHIFDYVVNLFADLKPVED